MAPMMVDTAAATRKQSSLMKLNSNDRKVSCFSNMIMNFESSNAQSEAVSRSGRQQVQQQQDEKNDGITLLDNVEEILDVAEDILDMDNRSVSTTKGGAPLLLEPTPLLFPVTNIVDRIKLDDCSPFRSMNNGTNTDTITSEFLKIFSSTSSSQTFLSSSSPINKIHTSIPSSNVAFLNTHQETSARIPLDNVDDVSDRPEEWALFGDLESTPAVSRSKDATIDSATIKADRRLSQKLEQWYERFGELLKYKQVHGNCLVPHNWRPNKKLAQWVKRQRYQYRLLKQGRHSTLTMDRVVQLEDVGFVWNSHKAGWDDKFQQLEEFCKEHGHCNVPSTWSDNPSLAVWVKFQRRQYKLRAENSSGNSNNGGANALTDERIQRLLSLGFIFDPRKTLYVSK